MILDYNVIFKIDIHVTANPEETKRPLLLLTEVQILPLPGAENEDNFVSFIIKISQTNHSAMQLGIHFPKLIHHNHQKS